jgi:hypothetical protein
VLAVLALAFGAGGCAAHAEPTPRDAGMTRETASPLEIADALEQQIERGDVTRETRRAAYERASALDVRTAKDALGRAILAGRLAQVEGIAAVGLVREVERYGRLSAELDPTLRQGAAWRILGMLYVLAPAALVEHGDSETGLELLEQAVRKWPRHPENHLRLAEAYLALGDAESAPSHLCSCRLHRAELRRDDQRLLDELLKEAGVSKCP